MYYYEMTLNRKDAYAIMISWVVSMNYGPEVGKYIIVNRCDSNKIILGLAISENYIFNKNSILEDEHFLQILIMSYRLGKRFGNNIGIKLYKRIRFKFYPVDYPGIENYVVVENYSFTGPTYYTSQITYMVAGKVIGIIQGTCLQCTKGRDKDAEFLIKVNENQENKQKINWNKIEML